MISVRLEVRFFPTLEISDKWGARKRVRISAIIDIWPSRSDNNE